jgi:fido (protein-threonine AMPylation protein)
VEKNPYEIDFESYIREGEPDKKEKSIAWSIATGLQQVDGLTPSAYLYKTAKRNIEGEISIEEAKKLIDSYYESKTSRTEDDDNTEEADKVSTRITELLSEKSFSFTPNQLLSIHERLFKGVFYKVKAGKFRDYNITKKEWVLNGDTVLYANADLINETLKYDFETEKNFDYSKLSKEDAVKHITRFVANMWQIHPFGDALVPQGTNVNNFHSCKRRGAAYGNTRTTAVFTIKYLRSLGFNVNNEPFEKHSWYFRNALVRANYTNMQKGIYMNTEYLEKFFRNILLGESNELKNRYTHIDYDEYIKKFGDNQKSSVQNLPVNDKNLPVNKVQAELISFLKENPSYTYDDLAEKINRTRETVRVNLRKLEKMNLLKRVGADKNGHWEVIE